MTSTASPSAGSQSELIRRLLSILVVALLGGASVWILAPFLPSFIWGTTIAVATWPLLERLQASLGGRRGPAAAVMTLVLLLAFFGPLLLLVMSLIDHAGEVANWVTELARSGLPPAPAWVEELPIVGARLSAKWASVAAMDGDALVAAARPWLAKSSSWLLAKAGGLLMLSVQFFLTAILTTILFLHGEKLGATAVALARKLAGESGEQLVLLAGRSVRGVALGVVVTALVQTVLASIMLAATGVPGVGVLGGAVLVLCLAQVGPLPVLAAAVSWLYRTGHPTAGTVLLVAALVITTLDSFLRPMLIRRGANLPLLLVFAGVIGGMLAFGVLGIFVGPVILAVTYTVLRAWMDVPARGAEAAGTAASA
jgi:predicted PurR-regulated permease PerM